MNDNAKKWVNELRSGKYKQGKHCLRTGTNEYCCLGVACELAVEAGLIDRRLTTDTYTYFEDSDTSNLNNGTNGYLPNTVRKWLGLSTKQGIFGSNSLAAMNDNGISFSVIADMIESEPEGLFNG